MANPFLGEIRPVAYNFASVGFAFCNGQLIAIQQNTALFSLLGTYYGGNGTTNFSLPNLQNAAPMGSGDGPGLTPRVIGEQDGLAAVTLLTTELPQHVHVLSGASLSTANAAQNVPTPTTASAFGPSNPNQAYSDVLTPTVPFSPLAIGLTGGNQPHENRQPILAVNFLIALQGDYPPRP